VRSVDHLPEGELPIAQRFTGICICNRSPEGPCCVARSANSWTRQARRSWQPPCRSLAPWRWLRWLGAVWRSAARDANKVSESLGCWGISRLKSGRPSQPYDLTSLWSTQKGIEKRAPNCSRHVDDQTCHGRRTRSLCGNGRLGPIWQKNPPDQLLIECGHRVRLRVAVAVEHRPKYQHKRFLSWGVRAWAKPV